MSRKLYIYVRSLDGSLGGPLFSTLDLFRLLDRNMEVSVVSRQRRGTGTSRRLEELGLSETSFITVTEFLSSRAFGKDDILHAQHVFDPLVGVLCRFAQRKEMAVVLSPRGALDEWSMSQKSLKKKVAHQILGRAFWTSPQVIHCTAESEAKQVRDRLGNSITTAVVPNVVSHAWQSGLCAVEEQPAALYLSRLHTKKRPDLAIRGVANLLRERKLSHLTVAGPGDEEMVQRLEKIVRDEGIEGYVRFAGPLNERQCLDAYRTHEIFLLPTSQENFGRVLFEALAFGMAVFVPDQVDTWPELSSLGALAIEQNMLSIEEAVNSYLQREHSSRLRDAEDRSSKSRAFLSRDSLTAGYVAMYSQALDIRS